MTVIVPLAMLALTVAGIIFAAGKQSKATEALADTVREGFLDIAHRQDGYTQKLDQHIASDVLALSEINRSIGRLEGEVSRSGLRGRERPTR